KNGLLGCGCLKQMILKRKDEIKESQPYMSKKRKYHCCQCFDIISFEKMNKKEPRKFICEGCYKQNVMNLPDDDERKIRYKQSSEYQRHLVKCVVCEIEHSRFNYIEGAEDFCCWDHQIVYLVCRDITNPNKDLWTRIRHYTETGKLSSYKLNKSAILRTVLVKKKILFISYEQALEEKEGDIWNSAGEYDIWNEQDQYLFRN
ncbi:401_t:CDS:1, partial [Cetraspora pellucida]